MFLEGFGVPLPVEVPLLIIGRAQVRGAYTYWEMVLLMWGSTVAGNLVGYTLGYYGGRPFIQKIAQWCRVKPELLARVERWFNQYGLLLTVGTRWFNWGFAQNMWLCGITRVPFGRFFVVMVVNDLFWAMGWTWVAAALYRQFGKLHHLTEYPALVGGLLIVSLLALGTWVWHRLGRQANGASAVQTSGDD